MAIFLGGKPPTKATGAEGVGYPFCSSVNWVSGVTEATEMLFFKRDTKPAVPTYILLLKILQQPSKEKDFLLCKYTANHGIIPM